MLSNVPTISFKALQRARTTIEDFVCSYFPYHHLPIPQALFTYLDVLVFVEATIYQMDEENESLASNGATAPDHKFAGEEVLMHVLNDHEWMDSRIQQELKEGLQYWALERQIANAMLQQSSGLKFGNSEVVLADVLRAHERKSFDYRVLHLLLHKLTNTPYNEALLQFLRIDELLVDIGDDLTDYEEDVCANSFNIYRGFIHSYGAEAQLKLVEHISCLESEHTRLLRELPEEVQRLYRERQLQASEVPGSEKWVFPSPIFDEKAYRQQCGD